ncbi:MAG: GntR family transcriptional regulator [Atopobiaceae bacterium]|nr:GntR family transcriptional regulator [Atopobiaceae bacterium]
MSKYAKVAAALQSEIEQGTYEPGDKLPITPDLCKLYGVSNTTIKKALDELEQLGLIARRRGSGIYVKSASSLLKGQQGSSATSGQMTGLTAEFARTKTTVTSDVHEFTIVHPSQEVADSLDMSTQEFVYYICRTRLTEGKPRNVEYTYMPISLIPGLVEEHVRGSIYHYIEDELGLKIGSAHRVLRAVLPTEDEVAWLKVESGAPLFEVRQVAYLDDGVPFEYSTVHHTSDYEFYVVSTH